MYLISQVEERGWTASQRQEAVQRFYRMHCFETYGGQDWMMILLALGHCNEEVIRQANMVLTRRLNEKTERVAATHTQLDRILCASTRQQMQGFCESDLTPVRFVTTGLRRKANQALEHAKIFSKLKK